MTRPMQSSKVILIEARREQPAATNAAPVRRYRLAKLGLQPRSHDRSSRFDHLRRVYD